MGGFFSFIFGIYFIGVFVSSFYFWGTRVDRSLAPIVRRFMAFGYGLGWPYFLFSYFAERNKQQAPHSSQSPEINTRSQGDNPFRTQTSTEPPAGEAQAPPRVANPFRD